MKLLQDLLRSLKQVKQSYETQHPPLQDAANDGDIRRATRLIADGADVNARSGSGWTALHWAICGGHQDMVVLLLQSGANADAADAKGETPLHHAAQNGSLKIVQTLLDAGANANLRNAGGKTPLDLAADTSQEAVRKMLLLPNRQKVIELLEARGARKTDSASH